MLSRLNLLIVTVALASAALGLWLSLRLQPADGPPALASAGAIPLGQPRTDFQRPDLSGISRRLSEWDGKLVVLNFWASWCGPCRQEMPLLDRRQRRDAGKGLQVIGVAADTSAATRAFLTSAPVDYPILIDDPERGEDLSLAYGNTRSVLPYTILIGRDGKILARHAGEFTERSLDQWLAPHL